MARILIGEPTPEVRVLLVRLLAAIGHDPIVTDEHSAAGPLPELFLFEADSQPQLELARALRLRAPDLPLVICSVLPPTPATIALTPVRHLLKPFRRADLAAALALAGFGS